MYPIIIISVVILAVFFLKFYKPGNAAGQSTRSPLTGNLPLVEVGNDKLIVVSNAKHDEVKQVLSDFCRLYNQEDYRALPRLFQLPGNAFAVTFPYDIDFTTFCFAINYLRYPQDVKWNAGVTAWTTITPGDYWQTAELENKQAMLYVDKADTEYDNVSLTTADNLSYKLSFARSKPKALNTLPEIFRPRQILLQGLEQLEYEDFK
jgi:hypothetical protein